jgi:hypothetical protein
VGGTVKGQTSDRIAVTVGKIEDPLLAYGADAGMRVIGVEFTVKNVGKTKYDDSPGAFVSTVDGEISGGLITGSGPCNTPSDLKLASGQREDVLHPVRDPEGIQAGVHPVRHRQRLRDPCGVRHEVSHVLAVEGREDALDHEHGSGEGVFESRAAGGLAVRRQHDLHGPVEQRPQPGRDLLDRDAFR